MLQITVTDREGAEHLIHARAGRSVMENIRDAGVDELLALCGGALACATCHVYVDESFTGKTGRPNPDEIDLLDSSEHLKPSSRLSCQILFQEALDGLRVTIAPAD